MTVLIETTLVNTTHGVARVLLALPRQARSVVVLGHGAGGDLSAPTLTAVADGLQSGGIAVARVDQPYRVAGRRAPAPAAHLDASMLDVIAWLRTRGTVFTGGLFLGGKSSGARVACRIARRADATGVIALGFPLHPPGRPAQSRRAELMAAGCRVLVCQGTRDTFGTPADIVAAANDDPSIEVHAVAGGDHSFVTRRVDGRTTAECLAEVTEVVSQWVVAQARAT